MTFSFSTLVWLILIIAFTVVELATVALVSIWFVVGAAAALIVSAFTPSAVAQITVFVAVSALALLITRPLIAKKLNIKRVPTNADRNIGRTATVIVDITPETPGRIKLDGVDWTARASQPIAKGTLCKVEAVHGTALTVSPVMQTATV